MKVKCHLIYVQLSRGWGFKFATGHKYVTKTEIFFNKWPLFCSKIGMLRFLGIENLHKKFGVDISKIVDFFLMSNFWWSFFSFFLFFKKQRNDHQKLDNRKKSTIFERSSPNFLCKFSTPKNNNILILEQKISHLVA